MRRLIFGVALIILALAAPAIGQNPRRPVFSIYGFIDFPSPFRSHPYEPGFVIAGWTFDCRSGQQPPFVAVLRNDSARGESEWITSYTVMRGLSRPDVLSAYASFCPTLGSNDRLGYHVYIHTKGLQPGLHFFTVFWTTGDGLSRSQGVGVDVP